MKQHEYSLKPLQKCLIMNEEFTIVGKCVRGGNRSETVVSSFLGQYAF